MAGSVRVLRRRISATKSTKKITKAMELVATSRIAKAQERVSASRPYATAITIVLTALASNASIDHPLLQARPVVRRAGGRGTQTPVANHLAPMRVVETEMADTAGGILPAYEFEPDPEGLLDALLPKYINTRIYAALIDAAASESAARRRAMKAATDNAEEMIQKFTREMNSARQSAITQEISEIVGGANALTAAGSEV